MAILVAANFDAEEWAAWWPLLEASLPEERLIRNIADCSSEEIDIALVANPPAGTLHGLESLQLIQSLWAGVDTLLADQSIPAHVPLARMADPLMSAAMAETVLWAVLSLHRGHFGYAAQQRAGEWRQQPLRRAEDINVAVLGLGQMGRCAAQALVRQGYRVNGWSTHEAAVEGMATSAGDAALAHVLARANVVVNLLPLTPATRGLFNAATLAQMPRGSSLVNLARGAHVVDADLLAALASRHIAHAVLDVFHAEPLPAGHPYWAHPRVTVLPQVAEPTDPRSAAGVVAQNVRALREGRPLAHVVDRLRGY